jgi:hypothetical protein
MLLTHCGNYRQSVCYRKLSPWAIRKKSEAGRLIKLPATLSAAPKSIPSFVTYWLGAVNILFHRLKPPNGRRLADSP